MWENGPLTCFCVDFLLDVTVHALCPRQFHPFSSTQYHAKSQYKTRSRTTPALVLAPLEDPLQEPLKESRTKEAMSKMGIRALELFSGIGGQALALKTAGVKTIGYCEIDDVNCDILRANMERGRLDRAPIFSDVKKLTRQDLPKSTCT